MASKIKGLQMWCRKMTEGYRDVDINNFTTSWRDGLAFCAIIHRFRPDLIDYDSLSKENVYDNNHLAFTVGEKELDIPAFLEASDMVALKTPDKLSVITYVSQYYNKLSPLPQLGGPGVRGKTAAPVAVAGTKRHQKAEPSAEPEPKKQPPTKQSVSSNDSKTKTLGDKCAICGRKVYLLERHVEEGQLYHRSCFRHSDLSPTNKVYTRSPFLSPSLHGKEAPPSPVSTPTSSLSSLGKTHQDNKQGTKRPVEDAKHSQVNKKSDVQKSLFFDKNKGAGENKPTTDLAKDKPYQSHLQTRSQTDTLSDSKFSPVPKFDAKTFEKHSSDFLSREKDVTATSTPKRQLPLVLQTGGNSSGVDSSKNKGVSHSKGVTGLKSDTSETNVGKVKGSVFFDNKTSSAYKSSSDNKILEKNSGPTAKPRNVAAGRKVFEEKTEDIPRREKSSDVLSSVTRSPRPAPRNSLFSDSSRPSDINKNKSPTLGRPNKYRARSPARDLSPEPSSPPPLPSSDPPRLPVTSPAPSRHPPSRFHHVASPSDRNPKTSSQSKGGVDVLKKSGSGPASRYLAPSVTSGVSASSASPSVAVTASSSAVADRSPASTFTSKTTLSVWSGKRQEEPMDVDTAFSKARAQHGEEPVAVLVSPVDKEESKSTLTGLLKSLANVRNTKTPTATTNTASKVTETSLRDPVTVTFGAGKKSQSDTKVSTSATTAAKNTASKISNASVGDTVTVTFSTDKKMESSTKPQTSVSSKLEVKENGGVSWLKKNENKRTVSPTPRTRNRVVDSSDTGMLAANTRRDQASSPGNVLSVKNVTASKDKASIPESSQPPPFTQVKLRGINKTAADDRKERPSSVGIVCESDSSKSEWQLEAERRMEALKTTGFVDPENKKSVDNGDTAKENKENSEGEKELSVLKLNLGADGAIENTVFTEQGKVKSGGVLQGKQSGPGDKGMDVSPPEKPKRFSLFARKQKDPEVKTSSPAASNMSVVSTGKVDVTVGTKKKIGVRERAQSPPPLPSVPPPRPSTPPQANRKKISVDIQFDFNSTGSDYNSSNSMEQPAKGKQPSAATKLSPPARPPPPRTETEVSPGRMSAIELQKQLLDIDGKLSELELRGRHLEDSIRNVAAEEEDDLMAEWFQLVTEKNDLVRKETDLVYMSREQDLEDEQSQIESQLRYLLCKDESDKSFEEQEEEDYLIQRKLEIVNQRDHIVNSMDEDRLRYEEEDENIAQILTEKGFRKDSVGSSPLTSKEEKRIGSSTFYT